MECVRAHTQQVSRAIMVDTVVTVQVVQIVLFALLSFCISTCILCWRNRDDLPALGSVVQIIRHRPHAPSALELHRRLSVNVDRLDTIVEVLTPRTAAARQLAETTIVTSPDQTTTAADLRIEVERSSIHLADATDMLPPAPAPLASPTSHTTQKVLQTVLSAWAGKALSNHHILYSLCVDVRDEAQQLLAKHGVHDGQVLLDLTQAVLTMLTSTFLTTIDPHLSSVEQRWVQSAVDLVVSQVIQVETRVIAQAQSRLMSCLTGVLPPTTTTVAITPASALVYSAAITVPASSPRARVQSTPSSPQTPRTPSRVVYGSLSHQRWWLRTLSASRLCWPVKCRSS